MYCTPGSIPEHVYEYNKNFRLISDTYLLEHVLERGLRALQHGGVRGIERVS